MNPFVDAFVAIRDFFEAGGNVLWAILFVTILMWTMIIERIWYLRFVLPEHVDEVQRYWESRSDQTSWIARRIREGLISELSLDAHRSLPIITACLAILPLLGLLGTVSGMVAVFDVMAFSGTGNARAMASGVSQATIPTMAGLVAALSGLWLTTYLKQRAGVEIEKVEDLLRHH